MFVVSENIAAILPYLWSRQNKNNKRCTLLAVMGVALTIAFNLSVPLIFKELVDAMSVNNGSYSSLSVLLLLAYGVCWLLGRYLEKLREVVFFKPMAAAVTAYSLDVFNHIHAQSLKFHLDRETGRVASAIHKSQMAMIMMVTNLLFRILPVFIEVVIAFFILWQLVGLTVGIVLVLTLWIYLMVNYWVMAIFKKAEKIYQDVDVSVDKRVVDSLLNSENIKFLNALNYEVSVIGEMFLQREKAIMNVFWAGTFATVVQSILLGCSLMTISVMVARDVLAGSLEVGDFVLVNSYLILLFNPLELITGFVRNVISYSGDLSHSTLLLRQSQSIQDKKNARSLTIQSAEVIFKDVSFYYNNKNKTVLTDFNLTIPAKNTVAIVGSSGSGKSTISRLLFRFYEVNGGAISIDKQNINAVKLASLRKQIAFVPQDIVLLNKSLYANIVYGNVDVEDAEVKAMIKAVHLDDLVNKLPEGLNTIVGERGVKLSGGERQRIAIARALLRKPKVIVFDEATSSLDVETEKKIQANIYVVTANVTTILIAHRLETVVHADKIVVLDKGKIVEEGSHDQLMVLKGVYANLWGRQHENEQ